jgi:hypothetical protein
MTESLHVGYLVCGFCEGVRPHNGVSCNGCGEELHRCRKARIETCPNKFCPVCDSKDIVQVDGKRNLQCRVCRTCFDPRPVANRLGEV